MKQFEFRWVRFPALADGPILAYGVFRRDLPRRMHSVRQLQCISNAPTFLLTEIDHRELNSGKDTNNRCELSYRCIPSTFKYIHTYIYLLKNNTIKHIIMIVDKMDCRARWVKPALTVAQHIVQISNHICAYKISQLTHISKT